LEEEGASEVRSWSWCVFNALRFSENCSKSDQTSEGEVEAGFNKLNIL